MLPLLQNNEEEAFRRGWHFYGRPKNNGIGSFFLPEFSRMK